MSDERPQRDYSTAQRVGLLAGGIVFLLMLLLPAPEGLSGAGWRTTAVGTLMAVWWMTEAPSIPVTAFLPLALFPLLGVLPMEVAAEPFANDLIFLFMGGFFLAVAMERRSLHRRAVLAILARPRHQARTSRAELHAGDGIHFHVDLEHGDDGDDAAHRHGGDAAVPSGGRAG